MKWLKSLAATLLVVFVLVTLDFVPTISTSATAENNNTTIDNIIFPHDKVIDVNIQIDEDVYQEMNANAMSEEIVMADITYNGYTFSDIGIRPKGNSSLKSVANSESDRYSFKIDFNYYLEDQSFYGITKINLNNLFSDSSMMAEYLGYEMLQDLDAVSSRTSYVALSINGEYFGLYLAVEQVNDSFLVENFDNDLGELYKPDMGTGSDLSYISDDGMDYTGMFPENMENYDNESLAELIKIIETDGDLDSIFNVDSFLKYLAVSTMSIHLDSYQGGMFHNYYLYNNDGIFEWISWDLNMIFNGFPMSSLTDLEATEFLIDEPVKGSMDNYPLIQAIFHNEEYVEKYHEYLQALSEGYLEKDTINEKVLSVYEMIKNYVEIDPTSFYSYEEFEKTLFQDEGESISLLNFIEKRVDNVSKQLSSEIPSTNNGDGNTGTGDNGRRSGKNGMGQKPEGMEGKMPNGMNGQKADGTNGERPEGMNNKMPDDMKQMNQENGTTSTEPIDPTTSFINTIGLLIMTIVMIGTSVVLSKK
ncbi:CotH kinase family protein [Clostridium sediminicola]|uniref:CotH kinase family protein n=1 Tax=Clostridium sediminicola TaxID=3114879 RepID=UPI0031F1C4B1